MGGSLYAYDRFDGSLTRPLYGYITDLESGDVPRWVKTPTISQTEVIELFELDMDPTADKISRRALPDGVSRKGGGRGPTRYSVKRSLYLEQHRDRVGAEDSRYSFDRVAYELNFDRTSYGPGRRGGRSVPEDVAERLDAVQSTSKWSREVDGYHVRFRNWRLQYELGPRGGIQEVRILAHVKH